VSVESLASLTSPTPPPRPLSPAQVEALVLETLVVIRVLVENEQEPPSSLLSLQEVAGEESGWLLLVRSLITCIPLTDPLGPAVITLLLDDCPLPTRETAGQVISLTSGSHSPSTQSLRNTAIVLGCLAEKLAGPRAVWLLCPATLSHLLSCLSASRPPQATLAAIIALEKFSQTAENKNLISERLAGDGSPLLALETLLSSPDFYSRQVGFCAQWCLDNLFPVPGRQYSFETVDTTSINFMLNANDVSEYLKIGPNGLEARCDASSFESVRGTSSVNIGCWYYEVQIVTSGVMQIGWATKHSKFLNHEGYGIGDDEFSQAFDGCRQLMWYNASCECHKELPRWKEGDIVGCFIDIDNKELIFSLNGESLSPFSDIFSVVSPGEGFFPAASFMSFQQCLFNFGCSPFSFPPCRPFMSLNSLASSLREEERRVLPRPLKLANMQRLSVKEDSCTLCFDNAASVRLLPCNHKGFCDVCSSQLEICPMCRSPIEGLANMVPSPTREKTLSISMHSRKSTRGSSEGVEGGSSGSSCSNARKSSRNSCSEFKLSQDTDNQL